VFDEAFCVEDEEDGESENENETGIAVVLGAKKVVKKAMRRVTVVLSGCDQWTLNGKEFS
jgi:hypothetical protein